MRFSVQGDYVFDRVLVLKEKADMGKDLLTFCSHRLIKIRKAAL
jgi:hypothetical protein